jgi:DNA-binding PadR family transcriptional regulator
MKYKKRETLNESSLYILLVLLHETQCGYDISKKVYQLSEGIIEIKPGVMYPTLGALVSRGYIEQVKAEKTGREKKFYDITDKGRMVIDEEIKRLDALSLLMKSLVEGGKVNE